MRMRKKKNLVPRMEACGAWLVADPFAQRGHWHELMPDAKEIRLELGCGKGRFTAGTAAAEPDVLLIAVEKVPDASSENRSVLRVSTNSLLSRVSFCQSRI